MEKFSRDSDRTVGRPSWITSRRASVCRRYSKTLEAIERGRVSYMELYAFMQTRKHR